MQAVDTLEKFGQSYQSKVIAALLTDLPFLNQVAEITNKDYFESEQDKWIVESILDYQSKQFAAPTLDVFKVKLSGLSSESQKKQIVDRIKQIYDVFGSEDMDFVKTEYIKFSKFQKLKSAIFQSVDLIKSDQKARVLEFSPSLQSEGGDKVLEITEGGNDNSIYKSVDK